MPKENVIQEKKLYIPFLTELFLQRGIYHFVRVVTSNIAPMNFWILLNRDAIMGMDVWSRQACCDILKKDK